ncbi:conjugal transfer protein MobA [Bacteroides hominis]|uniref:plasmid mobilization protein n=1 Tax=Bacteroides hominis TaxID=2763023 RepID=UPI003D6D5567
MNRERKKGGRHPKLEKKTHHVMLRFNDEEWLRFLAMYEQTEVKAKAVFAKARIFGGEFRVFREDRTLVEYYTKGAFIPCAVPHDRQQMHNQTVKELRCHFSEKKAMALLYRLEQCTKELAALTRQIVELTKEFEERWSQKSV